jgi:hypothetical protein
MIRRLAFFAALLLGAPLALAQGTVSTGFAGAHASRGAFVDVAATSALSVTSFAMNLATGPVAVTVYTKAAAGATASGDTTNAGAWTLLTTVNVTGNGQGIGTGVAIPAVAVGAGQTQAFYLVTDADGKLFNANGNITTASNASMSITGAWESHGLFSNTWNGWGFQGTVCYNGADCGAVAPPPPRISEPIPTLSEWAMIAMSMALAGMALVRLRRRG